MNKQLATLVAIFTPFVVHSIHQIRTKYTHVREQRGESHILFRSHSVWWMQALSIYGQMTAIQKRKTIQHNTMPVDCKQSFSGVIYTTKGWNV